eukprot:134007-Hanusia_phi.AAC.1
MTCNLQRLQASAYLSAMPAPAGPHSAVRGIVLRYLEIVNASSLFQVAQGTGGAGGGGGGGG